MNFEELRSRFPGTQKPNGPNGILVLCPAHADSEPSLAISRGNGSGPLLNCFGGCDTKDVLAAVGLDWQDILPPRDVPLRRKNDIRKPLPVAALRTSPKITRWPIREITGEIIAVHVRRDLPDGKKFHWERPDGTKGLGGTKTEELPLYGIDKLADANITSPVFLVEGEKAADALLANRYAGIGTVTGSSNTPGDDALRPLLGREIYLWPDADEVGRRHFQRIGEALLRLGARSVSVISWAGAPEKGDAADFFGMEMEAVTDEFQALMEDAQPFTAAGGTEEPLAGATIEDFRPTDLWNGRLFAHLHRDKVRYCEKIGGWIFFNGLRWTRSEAGEVERLAKEIPRFMYEMAAAE
jgi:hypothetical protein